MDTFAAQMQDARVDKMWTNRGEDVDKMWTNRGQYVDKMWMR